MSEPIISIAMVTYRDLTTTKRFIDTVTECTKEPFELVVVDNGCPQDLRDYLKSLESKIANYKLIVNSSNQGIGIGMNQAMRGCSTPYIFRCDNDVEIKSAYWTQQLREIADQNPEVGAVGTAITGGTLIRRTNYVETDICLSNCMLIPRRTLYAIDQKMKAELPRVRQLITKEILDGKSRYDGYFKHLGGMLNYMTYHGGFWDLNFPYGADDFHYSLLIRYADLKIAKDDRTMVYHKDDSMRPEWKDERHKRVSEGFQYYRTFWEKMLEFEQVTNMWECWPINKQYQSQLIQVQHV